MSWSQLRSIGLGWVLYPLFSGVACRDHGCLIGWGSEAALERLWSLSPASTARLETRIKESTVLACRTADVSAYRYATVHPSGRLRCLVRSESEHHQDQQPCLMIIGLQ